MKPFCMKIKSIIILLISLIILTACQKTSAEPLSISSASPTKGLALPTITSTSASTATATTTATSTATPTLTNPTQTLTNPTQTLIPSATPDRRVMLMAVGDIMLGRTIGELIEAEGPEAPFLFTTTTLASADITLGNLESPISERGTAENKKYAFRAPIQAGRALALAGFDLVSIANNHILDYGPLALEDTLLTLAANQVLAVGAGRNAVDAYAPVIMDVDGLRLAFLAFMDVILEDYDYTAWEAGPNKPGVAWAHEQRIRESVVNAKKQADLVIVLVHNGYEMVQTVSKYQQQTAHLAIESGATLVIGSHPHVLQRIEPYQDGLIIYSMGNFVFDNFLFPPNYSAILSVELSPQGVESYELIDVVVQLNGVPQIMEYDLGD
jgi:poly-gamma-glutamate capsule biosynthesis protein CapA/YwtB (metallophosphatase superfamily)